MYIEQMYTDCLAEAAYYIESEGECVIIDPLREWEPYVEKAKERGTKIKYIFETHFHADFVSGHLDLARVSGATIVFGPDANPSFDIHEAVDGEVFSVGKIKLKVLHTPGHTPESSTFLLMDENGRDHAIFTGDTLFIDDVGRPDLAIKSDLTTEDLAGLLYESLQTKILPLADDIIVYPAHGAGSSCGKNMSNETSDTLGRQKQTNYALRARTREEFVKEVTTGILPPPQYFAKNAKMNKEGYKQVDEVIAAGSNELSLEEFSRLQKAGTLILDTRDKKEFAEGYIPGSIFIGLDGSFATWVGTLVEDISQPILVIAPQGREVEAVMRMARVGYDNCLGTLRGGFSTWKNGNMEVHRIDSIAASDVQDLVNDGILVVDVRKPSEFIAERVKQAINYPLDFINGSLNELDKNRKSYVHCKSGYRSLIAISILRREGYTNLVNINGGIDAIRKQGVALIADQQQAEA